MPACLLVCIFSVVAVSAIATLIDCWTETAVGTQLLACALRETQREAEGCVDARPSDWCAAQTNTAYAQALAAAAQVGNAKAIRRVISMKKMSLMKRARKAAGVSA